KEEFLKYYRGLSTAVLGGKLPDLDPSTFTLKLRRVDDKAARDSILYVGTLDWIEPFATKKHQQLNLEIRTWATGKQNFLFACVSPQKRSATIWVELHKIQDGYLAR
ncbi:MAG: hypothetical protein VCB43_06785, partial [Myxococcota bacterium]